MAMPTPMFYSEYGLQRHEKVYVRRLNVNSRMFHVILIFRTRGTSVNHENDICDDAMRFWTNLIYDWLKMIACGKFAIACSLLTDNWFGHYTLCLTKIFKQCTQVQLTFDCTWAYNCLYKTRALFYPCSTMPMRIPMRPLLQALTMHFARSINFRL